MFKKCLLASIVMASIAGLPLAQADDLPPVTEQQPNLLPPVDQPAPTTQDPTDTRWYVAPYGTFLKTGGDRNSHDGWGGGLGVGKMLNKHFNVELKGFYQTAA